MSDETTFNRARELRSIYRDGSSPPEDEAFVTWLDMGQYVNNQIAQARRETAREALERFRCIVSDDEWWEEAHLEYGVRESLRAEVDELVRRFGLEDGDAE